MSRASVAKIRRRGEARRARITAQTEPEIMKSKSRARAAKARSRALSRSRNLPKIRPVALPVNYLNPVKLSPVSGIVYQITNRNTGRKNWYPKNVITKLIGRNLSNYQILMLDPKKSMFRNPITRNPVYPRNLQRVRVN